MKKLYLKLMFKYFRRKYTIDEILKYDPANLLSKEELRYHNKKDLKKKKEFNIKRAEIVLYTLIVLAIITFIIFIVDQIKPLINN